MLFDLLVEATGLIGIRLAFEGEVEGKEEFHFCFEKLVVLLDHDPMQGVDRAGDICVCVPFCLKIGVATVGSL
jgi:hypothetical protein